MNLTTDAAGEFVIDDEPVGQLSYRGDVRTGAPCSPYVRALDGKLVTPIAVEYDEKADRTIITFGLAQQIPALGATS